MIVPKSSVAQDLPFLQFLKERKFITYIYLFCVYTCYGKQVEAKGQLEGGGSFYHMDSRTGT